MPSSQHPRPAAAGLAWAWCCCKSVWHGQTCMNRALSRRPVGVCLLRPSECTSSWLWLWLWLWSWSWVWLCRCGSSSCRWNWIESEVVVFEYKSPPEKQVVQCDAPDIVVTEEGEESGRVDLKCSNPEGAKVRFAHAEDKLQDGSSVYAKGSTYPTVDAATSCGDGAPLMRSRVR